MIQRVPPRTGLARLLALVLICAALPAEAATTDAEARAALKKLYAATPAAKLLRDKAVAILVFPSIVKGGFVVGGAVGNGALLNRAGKVVGHYNSVAASYGLQAGIQSYGYALFFMNSKALKSLDSTSGFEVGVGPSFVVVDEGMGKSMTSQTITQDIYAFIFSQQGLMAGMGIQGSKITKTK
jgi:lipid-binding SYLF domain-containing protein